MSPLHVAIQALNRIVDGPDRASLYPHRDRKDGLSVGMLAVYIVGFERALDWSRDEAIAALAEIGNCEENNHEGDTKI